LQDYKELNFLKFILKNYSPLFIVFYTYMSMTLKEDITYDWHRQMSSYPKTNEVWKAFTSRLVLDQLNMDE